MNCHISNQIAKLASEPQSVECDECFSEMTQELGDKFLTCDNKECDNKVWEN